jgi:hypothetical protein
MGSEHWDDMGVQKDERSPNTNVPAISNARLYTMMGMGFDRLHNRVFNMLRL